MSRKRHDDDENDAPVDEDRQNFLRSIRPQRHVTLCGGLPADARKSRVASLLRSFRRYGDSYTASIDIQAVVQGIVTAVSTKMCARHPDAEGIIAPEVLNGYVERLLKGKNSNLVEYCLHYQMLLTLDDNTKAETLKKACVKEWQRQQALETRKEAARLAGEPTNNIRDKPPPAYIITLSCQELSLMTERVTGKQNTPSLP